MYVCLCVSHKYTYKCVYICVYVYIYMFMCIYILLKYILLMSVFNFFLERGAVCSTL